MTQDRFWAYKDTIVEMGEEGFACFSLPHLIYLTILFAGIVLLTILYKKNNEKKRDNLRKGMALFLILSEIGKQCVVALTGAPSVVHLPLHICSFAEYTILIDAFWPNNRFFKPLLCYAFLPAALMALLFPTVTIYPPINFYVIHLFVMHAVIVAYIIARNVGGEIRINYAGIWVSTGAILLLAIPIYFINNAFGTNFMFLMRHSENPALMFIWNLSGGTGGFAYILGLSVLVILMFHLVFAVFVVAQKIAHRKKKTE